MDKNPIQSSMAMAAASCLLMGAKQTMIAVEVAAWSENGTGVPWYVHCYSRLLLPWLLLQSIIELITTMGWKSSTVHLVLLAALARARTSTRAWSNHHICCICWQRLISSWQRCLKVEIPDTQPHDICCTAQSHISICVWTKQRVVRWDEAALADTWVVQSVCFT